MTSAIEININEKKDGITLECFVTPRAKRSQIKGVRNGSIAVSLRSPPLDGRANEELIELFADALSIPKSDIIILRGEKSRKKLLLIRRIDRALALHHLESYIESSE